MIKHIPNALTMVNLFCGCMGIVYCLEGKYLWVLILIGVALIADFADGLVARALHVKSELGKQLDSLADGVTFGVLPGVIYFVLIENANAVSIINGIGTTANYNAPFFKLQHIGFLFSVFAVLRLGKFNIDTRQSNSFLGLATPAASLFVAGLLMIFYFKQPLFMNLVKDQYFLLISIGILCALMVSEIPMFSFKLNGMGWKNNEMRIIFLLLCIPVVIFLRWSSLPILILLYITCSAIDAYVLQPSKPNNEEVNNHKE